MSTVHAVRRSVIAVPSALLWVSIAAAPGALGAQETATEAAREPLIAAAREIMADARFCALITIDDSGRPQVRAMDPFPPEDDMVVWFATNPKSRKVRAIRNDPRVTLYYADPGGSGYVTIAGTARLVNDPEEKARRWKDEWESYYADREAGYLLVAVTPETLEILSYTHGITGDPVTWIVPSVQFDATEQRE